MLPLSGSRDDDPIDGNVEGAESRNSTGSDGRLEGAIGPTGLNDEDAARQVAGQVKSEVSVSHVHSLLLS